ncbi:hypothetical protein Pcinc_003918 [Petrolisthes cinctipes]|uniref:MARVEL domain-containing protein n=1 Tax=Petrolisthes cinctipes TaxID=88211 RepID=A0AAE1GFG5_PETCI|nr:hypothetical protein Pcinc_003918 [Petrolisthes cinctipes]
MRKLPGLLILLQLGCTSLGFLLAVGGTVLSGRARHAYGVFIFASFYACFSCLVYLALRVLSFHVVFCRRPQHCMNWNVVGLIHSGVSVFLMMVGSCFMVEYAGGVRILRAAGVFGFLGYTMFLAQLIFELLAWRKARGSSLLPAFVTASVVRARAESASREGSRCSSRGEMVRGEVALRDHNEEEGTVGFVGMKQRPVSSYLQSNTEVTTPMLYAPGFDKDGGQTRENTSYTTIREDRVEEQEEEEEEDETSKMMAEEGKQQKMEVKRKQMEDDEEGGKQKEIVRKQSKEEDSDDNMVSVRTSSSLSSQGGEWQVPR